MRPFLSQFDFEPLLVGQGANRASSRAKGRKTSTLHAATRLHLHTRRGPESSLCDKWSRMAAGGEEKGKSLEVVILGQKSHARSSLAASRAHHDTLGVVGTLE